MTTPFCEKYDWCQEHDDCGTPKQSERTHHGTVAVLATPVHCEPQDEDPAWLFRAQVWAAEPGATVPRVYLKHDDDGEELSMTADQLGEFIDQLDTFREALTTMREQLDVKAVTA